MARRLTILSLFFALASVSLWGQTVTGAIGGRVVDPSQAVVPGADVSVRNAQTGMTRSGTSNEAGLFRFAALPAGPYELTVSRAGFKKVVISNIPVEVGSVVDRTVVLEVGEVTQEVTVESNTTAVNTVTPDLGVVVNERMARELPLNGRSFVQLAGIQAGVQADTYNTSTASRTNARSGIAVAISGSRPSSTAYIFDGIPFKEHFYGAPGSLQQIDSIQEFKVQKGFFSGRYDSAGVINLVTKSGTNRIRGTLWHFLRNDNFDARPFFSTTKLPEFRQNQFGFEAGGPVMKNKLFWFASYEGLRFFRMSQGFATVPRENWLKGDFSDVTRPIIDPKTGVQFPNNQIPSSRFAPFSTMFMADGFIPAPVPTGRESAGLNYTSINPTVQKDDKWVWRADLVMSEKNKIYGRALWSNSSLVSRSVTKGADRDTPLKGLNIVANWTHVFGPRLVMDTRVGVNRAWMGLRLNANRDTDPLWSQKFNITGVGSTRLCNFPPRANITGMSPFGGDGDCVRPITNDYYYILDLNSTKGKHQMAFGFTFVDKFIQVMGASSAQGQFGFRGVITGNPTADFLLGHPETAQGMIPAAANRVANWWDMYFEDQIRITPNFSLTASIRYQNHPWFSLAGATESARLLHIVDTTYPGGGLKFAEQVLDHDNNDWAPRAGFAWTPFGSQDFVLRSSFGIFYDETPGNQLAWDSSGGPERGSSSVHVSQDPKNPLVMAGLFPVSTVVFNPNTFNQDVASGRIAPSSPSSMWGPQRRSPYLQTWTLSILKGLGRSMVAEAAYVGQHGLKLSKRIEPNRPLPSATDLRPIAQRRPWPNLGNISVDDGMAMSHYNAMQLSLTRNSPVFSFIAGYTFSKDTAWDDFRQWKSYALFDQGNSRTEWDIPHRFSFSWDYRLPRFEKQHAALRAVLGGWQFTGITTLLSGPPFSITCATDRSNTGTVSSNRYAKRLGKGTLPSSQRTLERWFDTSAFVLPDLYTYGNSGPYILDQDGLANQDLGLYKNFKISPLGENAYLQFRGEFFNAFNHANFGAPGASVEAPATYGKVTGSLGARVIQFALKLRF